MVVKTMSQIVKTLIQIVTIERKRQDKEKVSFRVYSKDLTVKLKETICGDGHGCQNVTVIVINLDFGY